MVTVGVSAVMLVPRTSKVPLAGAVDAAGHVGPPGIRACPFTGASKDLITTKGCAEKHLAGQLNHCFSPSMPQRCGDLTEGTLLLASDLEVAQVAPKPLAGVK